MDKYEYRVKLEEISNLVDNQDYEEAMKVVDSIDWRRVKSARTLCMVGEIYEANQRYTESREILLLAYDRAPIGKTVLYRLVELAIKMGDFDDAAEYYNEFVENSPNDNTKYILKYKIYKARHAPIQDQITILEEYKAREYTERWAYELARLYAKAGQQEKCIEECDDLILWFSEGKFVTKAMELKMGYVPLTVDQREKYEHRYIEKTKPVEIPNPVQASQEAKPIQEGNGEAEYSAETAEGEKESVFAPILETTGLIQEKIARGIRDVFAGKVREETEEPIAEELGQTEELEQTKQTGQIEEIKEAETEAEAATLELEKRYPTFEEPSNHAAKDLESAMLGAAALGTAVLGAATTASAMDLTSAIKTANQATEENARVRIAEAKPFELPPLEALKQKEAKERATKGPTYQPNIIKVRDLEEEIIEEEVAANPLAAEPIATPIKVTGNTEEIDIDAILAEATNSLAQQISSGNMQLKTEEPVVETEEPVAVTEAPVTEILGNTAEFNFLPMEESEEDLAITKSLDLQAELLRALQAEDPTPEVHPEVELEVKQAAYQEVIQESTKEMMQEPIQKSVKAPLKEENSVLVRHHLEAEEQKRLLTYFEPIPGVKEQVKEVLNQVQQSACDKTSKQGNIIVMGREGTGKTRLSEGLIKAICTERRMPAAKIAYLDAAKMQQKDPASVVAKLAGGFLVIEKAGSLASDTVEELSKAMNFRTGGLTVILEDEKQPMLELLKREEEFAEKFEAKITIPVFTNDELVSFARTYAKELGYKMDEMGVLALYTIIGDNQKEDQPISVAKVKDMVDKAIKRAGKGSRRLGRKFSKKHVDEDNRIILYEKDFEY